MSRPLDLLIVSPWFPYPADNGARLRAYHLLRELAGQGHRVRLVAGRQDDVTDAAPPELRRLCARLASAPWRWYDSRGETPYQTLRGLVSRTPRSIRGAANHEMTQAIATELAAARPDAVLAMELGVDACLPPIPAGIPVVLDEVELSGTERAFREAGDLAARFRAGLTYSKARGYWRRRLWRYTALTAVSEAEAAAVRRALGGGRGVPPIHVVPNGVDIAAYAAPADRVASPGRLLYNGALTYGPNRDAVQWFASEILPRITARVPEAHLVVTGRYEAAAVGGLTTNPYLRLTGFLPDLRPTLTEAALCVVPLRAGGGTRLKILEAWAAGVPVVSTTIGAAGLDAEDGTHLLVADSADAFADAVIQLLREPERAARLAANARRHAEERFDWRVIGNDLARILRDAVNAARDAAPEIRLDHAPV